MSQNQTTLNSTERRSEDKKRQVKIACIQFEPVFGDVSLNLRRSIELIEQATKEGARIIVLPELCSTGYVFKSKSEATELAETISDGSTTKTWCEVAKRLDVVLIAGIAELEGKKIYNSAVIIDRYGVLGVYRKLHLWGDENIVFEPGDLGAPVFETPFGRLSVAICYDGWFPETFRMAALQGADIVCIPTNWVPLPGWQLDQKPMATVLHQAAAYSNGLVIACADRVGTERGQEFIGNSLIIDHTGWPVAGPASGYKEEIVIGNADIGSAIQYLSPNRFNHLLNDRRTDVYSDFEGLDIKARKDTAYL